MKTEHEEVQVILPRELSLIASSIGNFANMVLNMVTSLAGFPRAIYMVFDIRELLVQLVFSSPRHLLGTSLVAQWLGICLLMQGTLVRALVQEDPTCRGATKPMCHNYWAWALEPASHNYWGHMPQLLKPVCLELCSATREATTMRSPCTTTKSSPHLPQVEEAHAQQRRPNAA